MFERPVMNSLMHDAINKFHVINIGCGTLALEIEVDKSPEHDSAYFKKRIEELLSRVEQDFTRARGLLKEITEKVAGELGCYDENEHFFKQIESDLALAQEKKSELLDFIAGSDIIVSRPAVTRMLHVIEEKALACAMALQDLKGALIKAGKYKVKEV